MAEVWLQSNRRAIGLGLAVPVVMGGIGAALVAANRGLRETPVATSVGWAAIVLAGVLAGLLVWQLRQPRVGYAQGHLLVNLRLGPPFRVPIKYVEAFLLGQGAAMLPSARPGAETKTIVIRIAEAATEFARAEVRPALGSWCDGYITIRGTWCEPIDVDLLHRLNQRLNAAQQAVGSEHAAAHGDA